MSSNVTLSLSSSLFKIFQQLFSIIKNKREPQRENFSVRVNFFAPLHRRFHFYGNLYSFITHNPIIFHYQFRTTIKNGTRKIRAGLHF